MVTDRFASKVRTAGQGIVCYAPKGLRPSAQGCRFGLPWVCTDLCFNRNAVAPMGGHF